MGMRDKCKGLAVMGIEPEPEVRQLHPALITNGNHGKRRIYRIPRKCQPYPRPGFRQFGGPTQRTRPDWLTSLNISP